MAISSCHPERLDPINWNTPVLGHLHRILKFIQRFNRRSHHIQNVGTAFAFGQDVPDTCGLNHSPDPTPGNNPSSWSRRLQEDHGGTEAGGNLMRDRGPGERNFPHVAARLFRPFPNSLRDLTGFTYTYTDTTPVITNYDYSSKAEAASPLHNLGGTSDVDYTLIQFINGVFKFTLCHSIPP
jgi:hypothetical protein